MAGIRDEDGPDKPMYRLPDNYLQKGEAPTGLTSEGPGELDIEHIFSYHKPTTCQVPQYESIRASAKALAHVIVTNTPRGADQTAAIRLLREAVMTANAAIALQGRLEKR